MLGLEFKYDQNVDVLFIKTEGMDRIAEKIYLPDMKRLYVDRFTKKVIGARLTRFLATLNEEVTK